MHRVGRPAPVYVEAQNLAVERGDVLSEKILDIPLFGHLERVVENLPQAASAPTFAHRNVKVAVGAKRQSTPVGLLVGLVNLEKGSFFSGVGPIGIL